MPHLVRGDSDEDDNLANGPPHGARVCRLGRVAELGLHLTQVPLLALDVGDALVQLTQLGCERVDRLLVRAWFVSDRS
jgi:hypothetical protein